MLSSVRNPFKSRNADSVSGLICPARPGSRRLKKAAMSASNRGVGAPSGWNNGVHLLPIAVPPPPGFADAACGGGDPWAGKEYEGWA